MRVLHWREEEEEKKSRNQWEVTHRWTEKYKRVRNNCSMRTSIEDKEETTTRLRQLFFFFFFSLTHILSVVFVYSSSSILSADIANTTIENDCQLVLSIENYMVNHWS